MRAWNNWKEKRSIQRAIKDIGQAHKSINKLKNVDRNFLSTSTSYIHYINQGLRDMLANIRKVK